MDGITQETDGSKAESSDIMLGLAKTTLQWCAAPNNSGESIEALKKACSALRRAGVPKEAAFDALAEHFLPRCNPAIPDDIMASILVTSYRASSKEAVAPAPRAETVLVRGDEVEVAEKYAESLPDGTVYDQGYLWSYDERADIWVKTPPDRTLSEVTEYAGCGVMKASGTGVLRMSAAFARGVRAVTYSRLSDPSFFNNRAVGAAFENCFVRVGGDGVEAVPHRKEHRVTFKMPWSYSGECDCPRWLKLLNDVFLPDADREEKILFLQEFIGACMVGTAPGWGKCVAMIGGGINGKGMVMDVLTALFEGRGVAHVNPSKWGREYSLARLAGKSINIVSELPRKNIDDTDVFKAVISGEPCEARVIRESPFDLVCKAGHMFAGNELPRSQDVSLGFFSRFVVLTFNRTFERSDKKKREIMASIVPELGSIAAWAIEGAHRLVKQGEYTLPGSSVTEEKEWRRSCDDVLDFYERCCTPVGEDASYTEMTQARVLYRAYKDYCEESGTHPKTETAFGRAVKNLTKVRKADGRVYYFVSLD